MLGSLINRLRSPGSVAKDGESMLLSHTEFNREISRERVRATRRAIPFCLISIELIGRKRLESRRRALVRLLHRNTRLTDHKADLGHSRFGVLLVDTPEMGGRAALDRLAGLCEQRGIDAKLSLRVHDPEGFEPEDDPHLPTGGGSRRRDDKPESQWRRIDEPSSGGLAVAVKEPQWSVRPAASKPNCEMFTDTCISNSHPLVKKPLGRRLVKRSIDVVGASVGLMLTSPVMIGAAIAIKASSPGPAFFKQTREGLGGKPFTIYKMRTMVIDAEEKQWALRDDNHRDGPAFKIKFDPRVTPVGQLLRRTCIDELPQLINVLRGDMSLVGPRPLPWGESRACSHWHRRRLDVRPGMTCYWQVDKASAETFDDWMRMDLRYVDRNGLWQDLGLMLRTLIVPITGRGSE